MMFLGMLIGLAIFGGYIYQANNGKQIADFIARIVALACFWVGLCGAIGWAVEFFA